jgi:putative transposase
VARPPRLALGGFIYHVVNRGVRRQALFLDPVDYKYFLRLLRRAGSRYPVGLVAYCLMPNHWHLVLFPREDAALSAYVQWLSSAHARYVNTSRSLVGHVYERRFRSVVVREERHLVTLLHYVESNPVRAGLVRRAENWRWSSVAPDPPLRLVDGPYQRPPNWLDLLSGGADALRHLAAP